MGQESEDELNGLCTVLTGYGPLPIETIETGDTVLAYDFTSQNWLPAFVERPLVHDYDGLIYAITVAGEKIEVTAGHPFWVADGAELALRPESGHIYESERGMVHAGQWVDSQDLRVGDKLLLTDNRSPAITALSSRLSQNKVYNLAVVQYHNYAVTASGVLVHNRAMSSCLRMVLELRQSIIRTSIFACCLNFDEGKRYWYKYTLCAYLLFLAFRAEVC